jgi:hypothetical protein
MVCTLFAALYPLTSGAGELAIDDGSDDLLQACLEAVLRQLEVRQLRLHSLKEKKACWGDV